MVRSVQSALSLMTCCFYLSRQVEGERERDSSSYVSTNGFSMVNEKKDGEEECRFVLTHGTNVSGGAAPAGTSLQQTMS